MISGVHVAEAEPSTAASRWRQLAKTWRLGDGLVGLLLLLALNLAAGPTGFWSADEAVAHQQVELLTEGRWVDPIPEPVLDPEGQWHTLSPLTLGDGVVGPYVKHPVFPAMLRVGDLVAGRHGRFLVPALGSVLAALLIAEGADRRERGSGRLSFWVVLGGTPLLFHGAMLWAHSLAIAAAAAAFLILQSQLHVLFPDAAKASSGVSKPRADRSQAQSEPEPPHGLLWPGYALLVGFAVMVRSEAAIFFVIFGCCLTGMAAIDFLRARAGNNDAGQTLFNVRPFVLGLGTVAITIGVYRFEGQLRADILGPGGDASLSVPPEPLLDLRVRGGLLWRWLVGTRPDMGFGLGRVIGTILLAAAAVSARPGGKLSLSPVVGLVGGLLFVPAVLSESAVAVGPAAPAVLVGLLLLPSADRFTRFVSALSIVYVSAIVATSYANGGGGDWGGRYLALLLPPAAIIALPQLWRLGRSTALRPLLLGAGIASAMLAVGMSVDVISARRDTSSLAAALTADIEREGDPGDLVITTDSRLGRLLGAEGPDVRLLQVPAASFPELVDRLPAGQELIIIDHFDPVELPDSLAVLAETPQLVRVQSNRN